VARGPPARLWRVARGGRGARLKALAAVTAVGSSGSTYAFHSSASGMMRAPALVFALAGTCFALRSCSRDDRRWRSAFLAGLFLALTAMTHLAYAAFLSLGIALMLLLVPPPGKWPVRLKVVAMIGMTGMLLSAPWWVTILIRHGPTVLAHAWGTHGNLDMIGASPLTTLREVLRWLANYGRS